MSNDDIENVTGSKIIQCRQCTERNSLSILNGFLFGIIRTRKLHYPFLINYRIDFCHNCYPSVVSGWTMTCIQYEPSTWWYKSLFVITLFFVNLKIKLTEAQVYDAGLIMILDDVIWAHMVDGYLNTGVPWEFQCQSAMWYNIELPRS